MERFDWDARYAEHDRLWSPEPNPLLVEIASALAPGRALELGCGEGADAIWLAQRGWKVIGVDFSHVALERAARESRARGLMMQWVDADLRRFVPTPALFDLVVVLYVHMPAGERKAFLANAASGLAPGGAILVVGHDRENPPEARGPRRRDVLYTPEEIALELPGLHVERAERVRRPAETDAGAVSAVDTLVFARSSRTLVDA